MRNGGCADPIRCVTALERTHQSTVAPGISALHQRYRKSHKVLDLESEAAQRIASKRIETSGDQDQVGNEAGGSDVDTSLECIDGFLALSTGGHRDIPAGATCPPVFPRTNSGIPTPLVHRCGVGVGLIVAPRLRAGVAMHVPL